MLLLSARGRLLASPFSSAASSAAAARGILRSSLQRSRVQTLPLSPGGVSCIHPAPALRAAAPRMRTSPFPRPSHHRPPAPTHQTSPISPAAAAFSTDVRATAALQEAVLRRLDAEVFEPALPTRSIVDLGLVKSLQVDQAQGRVRLRLQYPTAGHPFRHDVEERIRRALTTAPDLAWVKSVDVEIPAPAPRSTSAPLGSGLSHVAHVLAVSSCKGGVGKSTVAVNLALALAHEGNRVGLLDLDVYGPSLPALLKIKDLAVRPSPRNAKFVQPLLYPSLEDHETSDLLEHHRVKCLSFGHVSSKAGVPGAGGKEAAVLRGPLASKVVTQLLVSTEWGDLDYLVLDMPPGTGDIQITATQALSLDGAVVVTTPQELALIDVLKGLKMFEDMKVPTLAVVENMAYFLCGQCHTKHRIFGGGGDGDGDGDGGGDDGSAAARRIREAFPDLRAAHFALPLSPVIAKGNDRGVPVVVADPLSPEAEVYASLARHVGQEIFRRRYEATVAPQLSYDKQRNKIVMRVFTPSAAKQLALSPVDVRRSDPRTGEEIPNAVAIPEDVKPERFDVKGKYGVAIVWSDGHYATIYTFDALEKVAARVAGAGS